MLFNTILAVTTDTHTQRQQWCPGNMTAYDLLLTYFTRDENADSPLWVLSWTNAPKHGRSCVIGDGAITPDWLGEKLGADIRDPDLKAVMSWLEDRGFDVEYTGLEGGS